MARKIHCERCGIEINPDLWDGCEKYYLVDGEAICRECFKQWLEEWMFVSLDEVAQAVGVSVVEVG